MTLLLYLYLYDTYTLLKSCDPSTKFEQNLPNSLIVSVQGWIEFCFWMQVLCDGIGTSTRNQVSRICSVPLSISKMRDTYEVSRHILYVTPISPTFFLISSQNNYWFNFALKVVLLPCRLSQVRLSMAHIQAVPPPGIYALRWQRGWQVQASGWANCLCQPH